MFNHFSCIPYFLPIINLIVVTKIFVWLLSRVHVLPRPRPPFRTDVRADIIFRFYKVQVEECFCFVFFLLCFSGWNDRKGSNQGMEEFKQMEFSLPKFIETTWTGFILLKMTGKVSFIKYFLQPFN